MSAKKKVTTDKVTDKVTTSAAPLARVIPIGKAEREERQSLPSDPAIGKWYWLTVNTYDADNDASDYGSGDRKPITGLWCVVYIGTNYVELNDPLKNSIRIHFKDFERQCKYEPDHVKLIAARVDKYRVKAAELMAEIQEVTAQLGVGMGTRALGGDEMTPDSTTALVHLSGEDSEKRTKAYSKALVKAKDKTLPALFGEIERQNKLMARWMKAELLPWYAKQNELAPVVEAIEARIFNVELYAGLVESVKEVRTGKPAPMDTPLSVFQKRLYMDEECLAKYRSRMNFEKLDDFDDWLAEPGNFKRLLPEPRCVVAFRIRNRSIDYMKDATNWRSFINLAFEASTRQEEDKRTFLYIRNGEQLWRLETEIDFSENLFPDLGKQQLLTGQLYAKNEGFKKWDLITQGDYEERRKAHAAALWKYRDDVRTLPARRAKVRAEIARDWELHKEEWLAWREAHGSGYEGSNFVVNNAKRAWKHCKTPLERYDTEDFVGYSGEPAWADVRSTYYNWGREGTCRTPKEPKRPLSDIHEYEPWKKDSVYWDDVAKSLKADMDRYNRIVLVLQGLFDRSLCLHPHPPVRLFEDASFRSAIKLVYDDSRALVPGPKPDFEVYRTRLNSSLKAGDVTYGQQAVWGKREAERHNADERMRRRDDHFDKEFFKPPGDPGPGELAHVVSMSKRGEKKARFEWLKKRFRRWEPRGRYEYQEFREQQKNEPLSRHLEVDVGDLFNVSAYTPGDFQIFFADPRTRAEYAKWAPALLTAEDFHAGVRKAQDNDEAWREESDY